jgi:hypothetical protein
MAQWPIDLEQGVRREFNPGDGSTPWPLKVLRILGAFSLLVFPVVTTFLFDSYHRTPTAPIWKAFFLPFVGPGMVLLGLILLGAGFRAAGGVFRGAVAGAALYVLLGVAFIAIFLVRFGPLPDSATTLYFSAAWPLMSLLLLGFFGGLG